MLCWGVRTSQGWLQVGYATYYTTAPVLSLVLDVQLPEKVVFMFPELYQSLRAGRALSIKSFFGWVWRSVYQVILLLLLVLLLLLYIAVVSGCFLLLLFCVVRCCLLLFAVAVDVAVSACTAAFRFRACCSSRHVGEGWGLVCHYGLFLLLLFNLLLLLCCCCRCYYC